MGYSGYSFEEHVWPERTDPQSWQLADQVRFEKNQMGIPDVEGWTAVLRVKGIGRDRKTLS